MGIWGDHKQYLLWLLDHGNIDNISPKAAVLMIGTNNSGNNTSEQIADGGRPSWKSCARSCRSPKILVLAIFPRGATPDDARRKVNIVTNERIAKLNDGQMIYFLYIGPKFLGDDGSLSKEVMPDLLHLKE